MDHNRNLKILMGIINKNLFGGPSGHLPYLVEGLELEGVIVKGIVYGARNDQEGYFLKVRNTIESIININKELKKNRYDIVHLNSAFDNKSLFRDFFSLLFLKRHKIPIFIKTHGTDEKTVLSNNLIVGFMKNCILSWASGIGVLSQEEKNNFIQAGLSVNKIFVIKNIIKKENFVEVVDIRKKYNLDQNIIILLFSARFVIEKGLIDVIEACNFINQKKINFHLFCLGDGPTMAIAKKLVNEYNLERKITFTGYIPENETKSYYAGSNIFLFPTYHQEGFPMALFQSVVCGLGIVTTKIRAAADYLKENENCLFVSSCEPLSLSKSIEYLINNTEFRQSMSNNNINLSDLFTPKKVALEFLEIYLNLLRKNSLPKILITSPSLDVNKNVSGVSSMTNFIIKNNDLRKYIHVELGKRDNEKRGVSWFFRILYSFIKYLTYLLKQNEIIIHFNLALNIASIFRDTPFILIARLLNRKLILHLHGGEYLIKSPTPKYFLSFIKYILSKADYIIVLSDLEKNEIIKRYHAKNIFVLTNSIDLKYENLYKRVLTDSNEPLRILFLGRLVDSKGTNVIIDAMELIQKIGIKIKFICAGDGLDKNFFIQEMSNILYEHFVYVGVVSGMKKMELIDKSDILLLPSIHGEGLPVALLETMARGVVPITTTDGSISVVVESGKNGLIVAKNSSQEIANQIGVLNSNRLLLKLLSDNASETILKNFNPNIYINTLNKIYDNG